jgi:hypothetical protein
MTEGGTRCFKKKSRLAATRARQRSSSIINVKGAMTKYDRLLLLGGMVGSSCKNKPRALETALAFKVGNKVNQTSKTVFSLPCKDDEVPGAIDDHRLGLAVVAARVVDVPGRIPFSRGVHDQVLQVILLARGEAEEVAPHLLGAVLLLADVGDPAKRERCRV